MLDFLELWFRGFVFAVAFVIIFGIMFGGIALIIVHPNTGVPLFLLIVLPLLFGILTEGKV